MNKQDFIESLRRNLSSINDYNFVNETVSYYENYIESQMRMGMSEEEVMHGLGDPRLIAKSIKATHASEEEIISNGYPEFEGSRHTQKERFKDSAFSLNVNGRQIRIPSWLGKILSIVIVAVIFFLVFTVLRWLSPFIFMGLVAYMVYKTFFGKY